MQMNDYENTNLDWSKLFLKATYISEYAFSFLKINFLDPISDLWKHLDEAVFNKNVAPIANIPFSLEKSEKFQVEIAIDDLSDIDLANIEKTIRDGVKTEANFQVFDIKDLEEKNREHNVISIVWENFANGYHAVEIELKRYHEWNAEQDLLADKRREEYDLELNLMANRIASTKMADHQLLTGNERDEAKEILVD